MNIDLKVTGEITDRFYKNDELIKETVDHNLVVNSFLTLVTALFSKKTGYSGIQYWAVGSGSSSWDTNQPSPQLSETSLTNEIGRKIINASDIQFLTPNDAVSNSPTNILQVKAFFGANDCNGEWREFGLFGGNATSSINTGIMINKRHHDVFVKTSEITVERTMKFTLNLV